MGGVSNCGWCLAGAVGWDVGMGLLSLSARVSFLKHGKILGSVLYNPYLEEI